ncbi:hypothetical protein BIW11_11967 [Tropilaelaps mercedesae]|uniref:Uncharacterized protein n=1 Tax=Tropilaelaps mercedesae TaxID=418985 RepID=A0A1V9X8P0_9ACAR|nr:hypothetical protein BIW11_11967 [Tropilaelaps mercedesae]
MSSWVRIARSMHKRRKKPFCASDESPYCRIERHVKRFVRRLERRYPPWLVTLITASVCISSLFVSGLLCYALYEKYIMARKHSALPAKINYVLK